MQQAKGTFSTSVSFLRLHIRYDVVCQGIRADCLTCYKQMFQHLCAWQSSGLGRPEKQDRVHRAAVLGAQRSTAGWQQQPTQHLCAAEPL